MKFSLNIHGKSVQTFDKAYKLCYNAIRKTGARLFYGENVLSQ